MPTKSHSRRIEKQTEAQKPEEDTSDAFGLERLLFFSDAVFAIAITLLSVDIRLPETAGPMTNALLWQTLLDMWPKYLGYVISFLVIGLFWTGHHRRFRLIKRYDRTLISLNLFLLMAIAFVPFPTSVLSDYGNSTATIFYASVMIVINLLSVVIWWYAAHDDRLIDPSLDRQERRHQIFAPLLVIGVFALCIGLAFIDADVAKFSLLLLMFTHPISKRL